MADRSGYEIERKFLVRGKPWLEAKRSIEIRQGYLARSGSGVVVRVRLADDRAFLTVKGPTHGITRRELEYPIPIEDAEVLLELCEGDIVRKTRHVIARGGHMWEIDVFRGANEGLVVAEIELEREDEAFERPEWLAEEVSHEKRYSNASLAVAPYRTW